MRRRAATPRHHPVFAKFPGGPPAAAGDAFVADFLGTVKRREFDPFPHTMALDFNEEYFEWIDLLEAVVEAEDRFTMIELGAGFGRWLVRGARAVRQYHGDLPTRLVGVEADPTHFEWMLQNFRDNGLDPAAHQLVEAAVDARDGEVRFLVDSPYAQWGQHIIRDPQIVAPSRSVRAVALDGLLEPLGTVDLVDLDVQGAEAVVLESVADRLDRQVRRIHVGTHSHEIEAALRGLFLGRGWQCLHDFACFSKPRTAWGRVSFGDGVQTWLNPRLRPGRPAPSPPSLLRRLIGRG
jgi:FkbM family methyltransferase